MAEVGRFGNVTDGFVTLGDPVFAVMSGGAVAVNSGEADYGEPLLILGEAITVPTSAGFAGGILYAGNGQLIYLGQLGRRTVIAGTAGVLQTGILALLDSVALTVTRVQGVLERIEDLLLDEVVAVAVDGPREIELTLLLNDTVLVELLSATRPALVLDDGVFVRDVAALSPSLTFQDYLGLLDFVATQLIAGGEGIPLQDQIGTEQIARFPDDHILLLDIVSIGLGNDVKATDTLLLLDERQAARIAMPEDGVIIADTIVAVAPTYEVFATDGVLMRDAAGLAISGTLRDALLIGDEATITAPDPAAPTIRAGALIGGTTGAADPQPLDTDPSPGWVAGDLVLAWIGLSSETVDSFAGATDDSYTSLITIAPGGLHLHRQYLRSGTIGGGAFDAVTNVGLSGSRRIVHAFLSIAGASATLDASATNFGEGPALPSVGPITTTGARRLIIAVATIRGSHITNPPIAPDGFTLLANATTAANNPTATVHSTISVAYMVEEAAGEVPLATWGGLTNIGTQYWEASIIAVKP